MRKAITALAALALLGLAAPAAAGQTGARLGWYGGADADDPVPEVAVYTRFDVPGPLNLELSAGWRSEDVHGGDFTSAVVPLRATAVLNLLPGVSPYLLAGVGAAFDSLSFHGAFAGRSGETALLYEAHAGAGLELSLGPLSVGADVRYIASTTVDRDSVRAVLGRAYDPSGWSASVFAGFGF